MDYSLHNLVYQQWPKVFPWSLLGSSRPESSQKKIENVFLMENFHSAQMKSGIYGEKKHTHTYIHTKNIYFNWLPLRYSGEVTNLTRYRERMWGQTLQMNLLKGPRNKSSNPPTLEGYRPGPITRLTGDTDPVQLLALINSVK